MRTQYVNELESVRRNLVEMGDTTVSLLSETIRTVVDPNSDSAARASELEARTDHQHRLIHDQCLNVIALQSPVARDARMVTGILDAIVDLELIADYEYEIVILSTSMRIRPPSQIITQISEIGARIRDLLSTAIGNWRDSGCAQSSSLRSQETAIRAECQVLYEKLSKLLASPGDASPYVNLLLIAKHLDRIGRHAVCVGEQAAAAAPRPQLG
jgi:phosphate transport system protein